jgi:MFS family permease
MTTTAATLPARAAALFGGGRAAACVGAVALVSLLAFEAMAVAAAMPAIATALDGLALYALAFGGMLASSVLGMVLAGRSCDRHGAWRATVAGLLVFSAGLLLAGFASGMGWLVAGRIVQGLGSGMLGVALYVGMGQVVPSALHPRLFALMAAAWVVPGLVGPAIAAALVAHLGWRAVFLVVAAAVPVAAALLLPAFGRMPAPPPAGDGGDAAVPPGHRVAWALLGALGALLLHGASQAGLSALTLAALVLGLLAAGTAARRLLPRGSLSAAPGLPAVITLRGLLAGAFASAEVFLPLYLTREQGFSLTQAGLALSLGAVMWSGGSALQARITHQRTRRRGLQAGFGAVAVGLVAVMTQMLLGHSAWLLLAGWAAAGFGIGLAFPMLSVLTLSLSAAHQQGSNASALQLGDALCSSAMLAVAGALFGLAGSAGRLGFVLVLALSAAAALTGALLARRAFAGRMPCAAQAQEPAAAAKTSVQSRVSGST